VSFRRSRRVASLLAVRRTVKAFVLRGEWAPRSGYAPTGRELALRKATVASQVWRNPNATLEEVADPSPQPDEVVIRVRACGVCGSDVHCIDPDDEGYIRFSGPARLPVILGHEYAGEVVEAGSAVTTLKVGDSVAAEGMLWCGLCEPCRRGTPNQCVNLDMVGFSAPGAYAEFIAAKERYCWGLQPLLASGLSDPGEIYELGALLEPAGCAYNGLFVGHDRFKPGVRVAVFGAGPIGLAAVALARAAGASLVVAFDPVAERVLLARAMGAHHAYNPNSLSRDGLSPVGILMELSGGHGFDLHVEAAGAADKTVPAMVQTLAPNGRIIYLGRTGAKASINLDTLVSGASALAGSRGHAGHGIYPNLIRMTAAGILPLSVMIGRRMPFPHVEEALAEARDGQLGKVMVIQT